MAVNQSMFQVHDVLARMTIRIRRLISWLHAGFKCLSTTCVFLYNFTKNCLCMQVSIPACQNKDVPCWRGSTAHRLILPGSGVEADGPCVLQSAQSGLILKEYARKLIFSADCKRIFFNFFSWLWNAFTEIWIELSRDQGQLCSCKVFEGFGIYRHFRTLPVILLPVFYLLRQWDVSHRISPIHKCIFIHSNLLFTKFYIWTFVLSNSTLDWKFWILQLCIPHQLNSFGSWPKENLSLIRVTI